MNERFNMPWEERPAGCTDVMWRYSKNPVIGRYHIPSSNSISLCPEFNVTGFALQSLSRYNGFFRRKVSSLTMVLLNCIKYRTIFSG